MLTNLRAYWRKPSHIAYIFLLPSLLVLLLFNLIPVLGAVGISFYHLDIYFKDIYFNGIGNYIKAFSDARFWNALKNTFSFAFIEMFLQVGIGLLVANALANTKLFSKFARTIIFIPVILSLAAVGIMWGLLFDETIGYIPYLCKLIGIENMTFFRDKATAMPTVIAMTVWKNFGYTMSILVVGIQAIPENLYEAARIDGASRIQEFRYVTLPGLLPSLGFCVITNLIGSFQVFDQVFVTTAGGPQYSTETLVFYIYKTGFTQPFNLGYACSMSILLLFCIVVFALPTYKKIYMPNGTEG